MQWEEDLTPNVALVVKHRGVHIGSQLLREAEGVRKRYALSYLRVGSSQNTPAVRKARASVRHRKGGR